MSSGGPTNGASALGLRLLYPESLVRFPGKISFMMVSSVGNMCDDRSTERSQNISSTVPPPPPLQCATNAALLRMNCSDFSSRRRYTYFYDGSVFEAVLRGAIVIVV